MPTFLTLENSPLYSPNTHVLDLDSHRSFDPSKKKPAPGAANGNTEQEGLDKDNTANVDDSFEESSSSSTHASDLSERAATHLNGTRPTSMSSLPIVRAVNGGGHEESAIDFEDDTVTHKDQSLPNGYLKMPDRTAPPPPVINGFSKNGGDVYARPTDEMPNQTPSQATAPTPREQTSTDYSRASESSSSNIDTTAHPSDRNPSQSTPTIGSPPTPEPTMSSASLSGNQQNQLAQHRFSSPASYTAAGGTAAASSSSLQVPPNTGLKQRHTLEVPKAQPGRNSRDGSDAAYASGRFSPTTAHAGTRRASLSLGRKNTRSLQSEAPRDEVVPDEDALRWAEAYRQKRASKRKKREEEDDEHVLVGTKVDEHHANWVTAYNMLTGIRVSVSRTNAKLDRSLTDADFEARQKSTFDIAGNELVPSAKYDFKFKDYAPWVFRHLRALFRLDPADYLMSLTGKYILSELGSPGKSGSFFYFSRDYKYIIKTIHHAEHKFLRKVLKDYYQHVTDNPNTLLSQFYGLHRVKMPYGKKIHFVVMNNLFPPHRDIHSTFDLKGSTIGRDYKEEDLDKNPRATLKDLNWLRRQRSLELGIQKKRLFLEQLNRDVELLKKLQIMDYSLLVGIHDMQRGNEENLRGKTLQVFNPGGDSTADDSEPQSVLMRTPSKLESARKAKELRQMIRHEKPVPMGQTSNQMPNELDEAHNRAGFIFNQDDGGLRATHEDNSAGDEIYYLGVIDCLTHYGMIKKIEHFWKGLTSDRTQISALPPQQYGERFFHFVEGITMSAEEAEREKQLREQEAVEAEAADREHARVSSWRSSTSKRRSSSAAAPPMPTHLPPQVPMPSGQRSPEAQETIEKAHYEAQKTEEGGAAEEMVPDKILTTRPSGDKRESGQTQPILPVVEEASEVQSMGGRSRNGDSDFRPATPAKPGPGDKPLRSGVSGPPPPTPPKTLKPESQDSGYGAMAHGKEIGAASGRDNILQPRLSRDSLNKDLPPLPGQVGPDRSRTSFA